MIENVIGTQRNLILAKLEGGPLANTGVIAGMSGSPVYVDGKLMTTLRGEGIVSEFLEILETYVARRYPAQEPAPVA